MKIFSIALAVVTVMASTFLIIKYHILMNLALNARARNEIPGPTAAPAVKKNDQTFRLPLSLNIVSHQAQSVPG